MRPRLVDAETGEIVGVELFVAVLGASNYTYAEATRTQQVGDFVASMSRALAFFGGAPRAIGWTRTQMSFRTRGFKTRISVPYGSARAFQPPSPAILRSHSTCARWTSAACAASSGDSTERTNQLVTMQSS